MVFKDQELIIEAYKLVSEKAHKCGKSNKECKCKDCCKKQLKEAKKPKPDYLDADKDGDKSEPMKKALKNKKIKHESISSFKELFKAVISEEYSNTYETDKKIWQLKKQIHPEAQYFVHYKDGRKSKPLKGESVLMTIKSDVHDIESVEPVHKQ
jgi:hypothetical protein